MENDNDDAVSADFDALPADADEATRQNLAEKYAPSLVRTLRNYPWMDNDAMAHVSKGKSVTRQTFIDALRELHNEAQLDVIHRVQPPVVPQAQGTLGAAHRRADHERDVEPGRRVDRRLEDTEPLGQRREPGDRLDALRKAEDQRHDDQDEGDHADPAAEQRALAVEPGAAPLGRARIRHELLLGPVVGDEVAPPEAEGRGLHLDRAAFDREDGREPRPLEVPAVAIQVCFGVEVLVALHVVHVDRVFRRPARAGVRGKIEQGPGQSLPPTESLQRAPVPEFEALDGSASPPFVEHPVIKNHVPGTQSSMTDPCAYVPTRKVAPGQGRLRSPPRPTVCHERPGGA
ncbi:hypothetical protein AB0G15_37960 [Streptosporangium sp. NPDC023825]|uniref:hypothetical protein n=1 Tax=Streptosporangium sp. NPDC023825 TaxID=3154909 RepID=UPI00341651F9